MTYTHRDSDSRGREQSARDTQEGNYQDTSSGNSNSSPVDIGKTNSKSSGQWGNLPRNRKGSP